MYKELFVRSLQHIFGSFIFDAPGLTRVKTAFFRLFFPIGKKSYFSYRTIFYAPHNPPNASLSIGDRVGIEHECDIDYSGGLTIKNNVWISEGVKIYTHDHEIKKKILKKKQATTYSPLVIEDDVWLGADCIILSSVNRIGKGAIIGAGAIVTKDVGDWAIMVGNPAREISKREG